MKPLTLPEIVAELVIQWHHLHAAKTQAEREKRKTNIQQLEERQRVLKIEMFQQTKNTYVVFPLCSSSEGVSLHPKEEKNEDSKTNPS